MRWRLALSRVSGKVLPRSPPHTGCYCTRFFCASFGVAIVGQSIFLIAIFHRPIFDIAGFDLVNAVNIEHAGVVVSFCGFGCFHAGNEYADIAGSFGIAREPGADSRGGA